MPLSAGALAKNMIHSRKWKGSVGQDKNDLVCPEINLRYKRRGGTGPIVGAYIGLSHLTSQKLVR